MQRKPWRSMAWVPVVIALGAGGMALRRGADADAAALPEAMRQLRQDAKAL